MKSIEVYLHGENNKEPKLVEVSEDATVANLISKFAETTGGIPEGELELYLQDEENPSKKNEKLEKAHIKKRSHVHCHRCQKIMVTVEYNNIVKSLSVPPSMTGQALLKKIAHEFGITDGDAADLLLRLADGTTIGKTDHVGSFSSYPGCSLKVELINNTQVKG